MLHRNEVYSHLPLVSPILLKPQRERVFSPCQKHTVCLRPSAGSVVICSMIIPKPQINTFTPSFSLWQKSQSQCSYVCGISVSESSGHIPFNENLRSKSSLEKWCLMKEWVGFGTNTDTNQNRLLCFEGSNQFQKWLDGYLKHFHTVYRHWRLISLSLSLSK